MQRKTLPEDASLFSVVHNIQESASKLNKDLETMGW